MKSPNQSILLKVLSLNAASVGISVVLGIITSKIIASVLGASGMALLASFRNFATMTRSAATLGISNAIVKLYIENKEDSQELGAIYSTFFWIFMFIAVTLGIFIILLAPQLSTWLFYTLKFSMPLQFFGITLPLIVINTFWLAIYNGMQNFRRIIYIQIISNLLVFLVTTYLLLNYGLFGGMIAMAIGEILMLIATGFYVSKEFSLFRFELQRVIHKKHLNVITKFSVMALLSAILMPLTMILVRDIIIKNFSLSEAGIWDAANRISSYYMLFVSSGLTMYYMPKLASIETDSALRAELGSYFKTFVPLFFVLMVGIYCFRKYIIIVAFTSEFDPLNDMLIWQQAGDMVRIMSLAFGFQILVKTMMVRYFIIEIGFNAAYYLFALWLVPSSSFEGAVQAYFYANIFSFSIMLFFFRDKIFSRR